MAAEQDEVQSGKNWSRVAELYAKLVNESDPNSPTSMSNKAVAQVVEQHHPLSQASFILDMGCGNGQVIAPLLNNPSIPSTARLVAADSSVAFVDMLKKRKAEAVSAGNDIWKRLEVENWDARELGEVSDASVSHLVAGHAYWTFQGENEALAEALRVLQTNGIFVETSMAFTDWGHLPSFIKEVKPDVKLPEMKKWSSEAAVLETLRAAGFKDVGVRSYDISLPLETHGEGVELVVEMFPFVKPLFAEMTEEEVAASREQMLRYLTDKYPGTGPLRMHGKGIVGWGRK